MYDRRMETVLIWIVVFFVGVVPAVLFVGYTIWFGVMLVVNLIFTVCGWAPAPGWADPDRVPTIDELLR